MGNDNRGWVAINLPKMTAPVLYAAPVMYPVSAVQTQQFLPGGGRFYEETTKHNIDIVGARARRRDVDIVGAIPARLAWRREPVRFHSSWPSSPRVRAIPGNSPEGEGASLRPLPRALPPANWTPFLSGPQRPQITRACGVGEQPYAPMRFGFLQLHTLTSAAFLLPYLFSPTSPPLSLLHSTFRRAFFLSH